VLVGIKHNIEIAHRLYETKGKCEQIHGHSMWVTVKFEALMGDNGMAQHYTDEGMKPLEYGDIKKNVRGFLDEWFDHKLLLNQCDPWAGPIFMAEEIKSEVTLKEATESDLAPGDLMQAKLLGQQSFLPGLMPCDGDPTTENIGKWIYGHCLSVLQLPVQSVEVWETSVNMAVYP